VSIIKRIKGYFLRRFTRKESSGFDIQQAKTILVIKYDRIGDMVVSTPIFRELKSVYPKISISVLASKVNKDVIKHNPYVDEIYLNHKNNYFSDLWVLLKLRKKQFDVCIELDHSVVPHAIFRLKIIKPKMVVSIHKDGRYGVKGSELELYDFFTPKDTEGHFGKIWLDTLIFFGIKPGPIKYDLFITAVERNKAKEFFLPLKGVVKIGINLEGSFKEKSIQRKELVIICKKLKENLNDIEIVILTSPNNMKRAEQLIKISGLDFVTLTYRTETILDVAALIEQLDLVITPDTSITHIASAFDKPIVTVHENNPDSFRLWAPISKLNHTVFAESSYGLFNYDTDEIVQRSIEMIHKIKG